MKHTAEIEILSKQKALALADYLTDAGIDVLEVIISLSGRSTIYCIATPTDIRTITNQFNEEYCDIYPLS